MLLILKLLLVEARITYRIVYEPDRSRKILAGRVEVVIDYLFASGAVIHADLVRILEIRRIADLGFHRQGTRANRIRCECRPVLRIFTAIELDRDIRFEEHVLVQMR